jgi:hypothetical protein
VRTPSITALCRTETSTSSKNEKMWALHLGSPFRPIRQSTSVGMSIWWYLGVLIVVTAPRRLRSTPCGMAGQAPFRCRTIAGWGAPVVTRRGLLLPNPAAAVGRCHCSARPRLGSGTVADDRLRLVLIEGGGERTPRRRMVDAAAPDSSKIRRHGCILPAPPPRLTGIRPHRLQVRLAGAGQGTEIRGGQAAADGPGNGPRPAWPLPSGVMSASCRTNAS